MKILQFVLASLLSLSIMASANATLKVQLSDTADFTGTVVEAADTDGDGKVDLNTSLGGWVANVVSGFSAPLLGSNFIEEIDLFSANISGGTGTIYVRLIEDAMTKNDALYFASLGGTTNGTVSFLATVTDGITTSDIASYTASGGAYSYEKSGRIALQDGNYTATLFAAITHGEGLNISSFDFNLKVPEPGSLALLGLGLISLGYSVKRRK